MTFAGEAARETQKPLEFTSPATPGGTYGRGASLQQLVAEALRNNPEIRAARKELEAASQRIAPAGALDDPMIEAGFLNVPVNTLSFSREDMTMKMLGVSQRFPYPGKRTLRQGVAEQEAVSVEHAYRETVNRVAREAKVAYYDLVLVLESTRLVDQNRSILEQLLKVADSRYSVGQGNQVDVLRAQTQLSRMNEELIKLGRDRPMYEAELMRLLGRVAANGAGPNPLGALVLSAGLREVALSFDALTEKALRERPQLLGLQSIVEKNQRAIEVARKDRYPDFDVKFSYGQRDNMPDGARRSDMVSVTVAMNLPVWRQTKTLPRIAEAVALHEQASNIYEAQRNETTMKLRQQIAAAEQNLRAAKLYENEILPQSRLTIEAAIAAYQVGRSDFALLLDNQMAILNFEIARATAIVNYNKALAEITFLTGEDALVESAAANGSRS
ncbi:MAG: TolC family protein [Burkholderiales bacterium]